MDAESAAIAAALEAKGSFLRGQFDPEQSGADAIAFCERRLLARIHRYTTERLRQEIEPETAQDFLRFLLGWRHVAVDTPRESRRGLLAVHAVAGFANRDLLAKLGPL
jgi:ATP-dependent Lhr-like helicase